MGLSISVSIQDFTAMKRTRIFMTTTETVRELCVHCKKTMKYVGQENSVSIFKLVGNLRNYDWITVALPHFKFTSSWLVHNVLSFSIIVELHLDEDS